MQTMFPCGMRRKELTKYSKETKRSKVNSCKEFCNGTNNIPSADRFHKVLSKSKKKKKFYQNK